MNIFAQQQILCFSIRCISTVSCLSFGRASLNTFPSSKTPSETLIITIQKTKESSVVYLGKWRETVCGVAVVAKPLIVGRHLDVPGRDGVWRVALSLFLFFFFFSPPHPRDLHSRNPGSWHSVYVAQGAGDMWGVKWLTVKFLISAICSICCLNTPVASLYILKDCMPHYLLIKSRANVPLNWLIGEILFSLIYLKNHRQLSFLILVRWGWILSGCLRSECEGRGSSWWGEKQSSINS